MAQSRRPNVEKPGFVQTAEIADEMDEAGFGDANMSDDDDMDGLGGDDDDEPMADDEDEL